MRCSSPYSSMYACFLCLRRRWSQAASVGEDVGETQFLGHLKQGHHVPHAGARPPLDPAPHRLRMDTETAVQLRPRQARLLLEPLEALREVVGEAVSSSLVLSALSRHRAGPSAGDSLGLPPAGASRPTGIRARGGTRSANSRRPSSPRAREHPFRARPPPRPDIHLCGLSLLP